MFHSHEAVLPQLSFQSSGGDEGRLDESARVASSQRVDLSQDVGTLLQLVTRTASDSTDRAAAAGAAYGQGDSSEPHSDPRACEELLASMSRQWLDWKEQASEGSTVAEAEWAQVKDLDGGWRGLLSAAAGTAAEGEAARDEEVEDMQGWQELADDARDDDDD